MKEILIGGEDDGIQLKIYDNGDLSIEELFRMSNIIDREVYLFSDEVLKLKNSLNKYLK